MVYKTIVAVFDTPEHARAAVGALKAGGFQENDISLFDGPRLSGGAGGIGKGLKEVGLWHRLFGDDISKQEATIYGQTVEKGGVVISMRVLDSEVARATGILDLHRPVDVHDRAVTSGAAAPAYAEAAAKTMAAAPLTVSPTAAQTVSATPKTAAAHADFLRLAEEQLQVGKEMIETGRTRVRRFTVEREVAQDVTLHEEHAEVLRRTISEPVALTSIDWADSEIEVIETAEHALVSKTVRVVEEIGLNKVGTDHIETVHEKLRRQQAEVIQLDTTGRPVASPRA
jgi:stress response protein YsnF